jgi:hypothetical protein
MSSVQPIPLYDGDEQPAMLVLTPEIIGTINRMLSGIDCGSVEIRIQNGRIYTLKKSESYRVAEQARSTRRNRNR